ncbi:TPR repeat-containing protein [Streptomyces viridochromogenes DSM 40736]|uniref:TPR repeat-containing protein n=2 Tax=Streptomyces viridochromogenes TaxID=1938 RepID=D9X3F1_STRVT|nr:TPR repeat-containing protein [Streptomyces viridochromogenes DSM 40736]
MASCQRNETSDGDGPLLRALAAVLREGPLTDEYLSAWSAHNELVSGVELLAALPTRWDAEGGQRPARAAVGDERPAFPNPLARPGTAPTLVEHLVLAARGVGHREEGWFFSGRQRVLGEIITWMEAAAPGLFLVTGPAGCGKSAVLGRVATLADPEQRQEAERQGALREGDPDPGVRDARTFAAVHLRGLDATQAAAELAARLGLREPRNADALRAELRELPTLPVLVLDGLDEVPAEHTQGVIEELVFPLSRMLPVLVGSRERPFRGRLKEGETLPDALVRHIGDSVTTVNLEAEPDTRQDIAEYVRRRCEAAEVDGSGVAEALADRATAQDGGFLFARLVTGFLVARLREHGGLRDTDDLLSGLPDSVEAAFEEDLRAGPRRVRDDGTELPSAARDLLTALAWAAGRGMPVGGVWEAVASALGGQGVVYDEGDVDWVLSAYGRYIVEDGAGAQAVYRLYHREFVSHLRGREGPEGVAAEVVVLRAVVDVLKRQAEVGGWDRVDPYVRAWLSRHAAWASVPGPGIDVLRDLVVWDRENVLPHLAEALVEVSVALSGNAQHMAAVEFAREATDIYRGLAGGDTAYLPNLARSLNNLANRLAETGDRQGALEPAHEAVRIRRQLTHANPAAYLPDLAGSLNNLAVRLAETGDRQGALEPAHEAVRHYTQLTHTNPAAYLPDLAGSLNNLANHLADTGDRQGALEPAHQAVRIRRQLTHTNPAAYLPDLAMALNNLAIRLAETGDRQGALEPAHEAVRIRRQLTHANPAAYLPDLAGSLNNLAIRLAETGDRQGALEPAHEAVRHYTQLTHANPAAYLPDLAMALNNLANRLADTGDRQGALEPAHEAVRHYTQLTHANPAAYLPELATSLNNLASRLADTGDRQGALKPAHEAVRIGRQLAHANPAAYLPDLAMALNNLANHLAGTGDAPAAIQAYTDTATRLDRAHPAAARAIEYERAAFQLGRPEPTRTSGLLALIRIVNDESADQPGEIVLRTRHALRAHARTSRASGESLEQTWRQETDAPAPDWLSLSEATMNLVVEWVNTPTWTDSRTFWSRHAGALGADEAATALAELALVWPVAEQHQRIRELVLSEGVDSVFQTLILRDTLSGWLECESWDDSKRFFRENSELLLDEFAENTLTKTDDVTPGIAVHAALLRIARAEDIDTAFQCVQDRGALQRQVLRALNDGDAQALAYAAAIEGSVFDDELSSATHHQAALLLAGAPESLDLDALADAASEGDPETRNRLTSELATLATRSPDPQHTTHWFRLVQALTQTRP